MKKPFIGLRPFGREESDLFFGRTQDIAILENLILAMPVLVVYAPSGTGKSSLLNAGVLPAIEQDPTLLPIMLNDPHANVLDTVREELGSTGWTGGVQPERRGLARTLERHLGDTDRRVILVLDQFEERLKNSSELETLYTEVARLANTRSEAATVVISIREDYLAGLEQLMRRVTGLLDASFRVPSLSRVALTEAVYGPLKAVSSDVTIDKDLVDEVLTDLEHETRLVESLDGGIEAGYFQIVWSHLWEEDVTEPRHRLTRETYRRDGRAAGILESFVSGTLDRLLPFEAEFLRAVTRYMVLPTGAKVAMTVDDLLGLLRTDDFTDEGNRLLLLEDTKIARELLESLFYQLTRTEAPLFRRAVRGQREEFELVHDLLGLIFLRWRRQYTAREQRAAEQSVSEVFRPRDGLDRLGASYASASVSEVSEDQPIDESILRTFRSAKQILSRYADNLNMVETAADATKQEELLKSAFSQVRDMTIDEFRYAYRIQSRMRAFLGPTLQTVRNQLRATAVYHSSREVRRVVQQQAYKLAALEQHLVGDRPYYPGAAGRPRVATWVAAFVAAFVLAVGGMAIAYWLIEQAWSTPDVQYMALTLAVVASGAALLYGGMYISSASRGPLELSAIRTTLWPADPLEDKSRETRPTSQEESATAPPFSWRHWLDYITILAWWPVIFVVFELACFTGAILFQLAGWSPTAGFNLAALLSAIGLGIMYLWATGEF